MASIKNVLYTLIYYNNSIVDTISIVVDRYSCTTMIMKYGLLCTIVIRHRAVFTCTPLPLVRNYNYNNIIYYIISLVVVAL